MKWLRISVILLVAASLVGCVIVSSVQREFIYPNAAEGPMDRPPPAGTIQHWLDTPDGARVESWLFLPPGASVEAPVPAVIFFHGNSDYIETKIEYAEFYTAQGFACLLVEYRGYRRSTGEPSEAALRADAVAFYDWIAAQPQIDPSRIAVHGHGHRRRSCGRPANRSARHGVSLPQPAGAVWSLWPAGRACA